MPLRGDLRMGGEGFPLPRLSALPETASFAGLIADKSDDLIKAEKLKQASKVGLSENWSWEQNVTKTCSGYYFLNAFRCAVKKINKKIQAQ